MSFHLLLIGKRVRYDSEVVSDMKFACFQLLSFSSLAHIWLLKRLKRFYLSAPPFSNRPTFPERDYKCGENPFPPEINKSSYNELWCGALPH